MVATNGPQQLTLEELLPKARLTFEDRLVPLVELPADDELIGPPPSRELVESIARLGVLQPIICYEPAPGATLVVADGRRRVLAARKAELAEVPTRVYRQDDGLTPLVGLVANEQRRPNPAAAFLAINDLAKRGASEQVISRATGLPVLTIRKVLRLAALPDALRDALAAGKITVSAAEHVVRLPAAAQARLAQQYVDQGEKLSVRDCEAAQRVAAAVTVAQLPVDLFATTLDGAPAAPNGKRPDYEAALREAIGNEWRRMQVSRRVGHMTDAAVYRYAIRCMLDVRRQARA